jgi:hypothetical protein
MKQEKFIRLSLFAAVLLPLFVQAQTVVRGPYLQTATPTSVIVKWRTDTATESTVEVAVVNGAIMTVSDVAVSTEHEVSLTGLLPDTLYNYTVGTASLVLAGGDLSFNGDGEHFFTTPPLAGTDKATRIWVIGDSGTADVNAAAVRDAYKGYTGGRGTDVWLMLGDNAYRNGSDTEYQAAVFNMYPQLLRQVPLWSALGNHDAVDMVFYPPGAYPQIFSFPTGGEAGGTPSGTENYYSFNYGNVHFVALDSSISSNRTAGSSMWTWLAADLAANGQRWTIAFWHHPHYSKGSHDSDAEVALQEMRQNAVPVLEQYGVDLVLTGHSHSYERSFLINGHHGQSGTLTPAMILDAGDGHPNSDGAYIKTGPSGTPDEGAVHAVVGSSGKIEAGGDLDYPAMYTSDLTLGSMVLDVNNDELNAVFLDSTGAVLDEFAIIKNRRQLTIDIDPWDVANKVKPASNLLIPVAINGSSVAGGDATDFDISQVNIATVRFGIGQASNQASPAQQDFNGDSETDLLLGFRTQDTAILCGDTEVRLTGETLSGEVFMGSDTITTADCENTGCHP